VRAYCESLIDNLAELHSIDYEKAGLAELRKPGEYTERQILGWSKRWEGSKTDEVPDIEIVQSWLKERIPKDSGACVIHNDYKFDNIVLDPDDPTRIVAVLDWEMATVGDPLMDLGTSLAYWSEPGDPEEIRVVQCFLTTASGAPARNELAERYTRRTGADISNVLYYYVFGLFKLAVIVQQIYYRYSQGLTKDERFSSMIGMVYALGRTGRAAIQVGRISTNSAA
jgi:aminoglycoside phosphotransferase (APT) family kinase protein